MGATTSVSIAGQQLELKVSTLYDVIAVAGKSCKDAGQCITQSAYDKDASRSKEFIIIEVPG
jgi:hypothetical protein